MDQQTTQIDSPDVYEILNTKLNLILKINQSLTALTIDKTTSDNQLFKAYNDAVWNLSTIANESIKLAHTLHEKNQKLTPISNKENP